MTRSVVLVLATALAGFAQTPTPTATPQPRPEPVISPEVHADRTVTFRFRAPNAQEVLLSREGAKRVPMQKDEKGLWTLTTEPLEPDYYGYSFVADGVSLMDPGTNLIKPNLLSPQGMVHVPGAGLPWEVANVPHGRVNHHFYHSGIVGDDRDFYVYTPPGYDLRQNRITRFCTCCTGSATTRAAGQRWARPT